MGLLSDPLTSLHIRSLGTIEDEQRQERGMHEASTAEEEGAEFRVLALFAIGGVKEPDGGVDADTEAAQGSGRRGGRGAREAILESNPGERPGLGRRTEELG
jgi:hypothetical protein